MIKKNIPIVFPLFLVIEFKIMSPTSELKSPFVSRRKYQAERRQSATPFQSITVWSLLSKCLVKILVSCCLLLKSLKDSCESEQHLHFSQLKHPQTVGCISHVLPVCDPWLPLISHYRFYVLKIHICVYYFVKRWSRRKYLMKQSSTINNHLGHHVNYFIQ